MTVISGWSTFCLDSHQGDPNKFVCLQFPIIGWDQGAYRGFFVHVYRLHVHHCRDQVSSTFFKNDHTVQNKVQCKLQILVYDILPSTTAVFSYVISSWKLSANELFFVGAQTVVSLLKTTQIKQGVSFIAINKVYTSTNKTTIIWIKVELFFFFNPGWMRLMLMSVLGC